MTPSLVAPSDTISVLVIDDEESYREALTLGLSREGFHVRVAEDGRQGIEAFEEQRPDIVLLDLMLPGIHGTEVCRRLQNISPVPIIMVSAINSELDVVLGLELGAAGYVTKPFRLRELVARIHAILRRASAPLPPMPGPVTVSGPAAGPPTDAGESPDRMVFGDVEVDFHRREVRRSGETVHLSRQEFDLLGLLLHPARRVRRREELIDLLWPDTELTDSRTLDTHIYRLRNKLEPNPGEPRFIVTVRGVGFRLDPAGRAT